MPPVLGVLLPHPPVIIPRIGQDEASEAQKTIDHARLAAKTVQSLAPDTIVVITPHGTIFEDAVTVMSGDVLSGTFGEFGDDTPYRLDSDTELVARIHQLAVETNAKLTVLDEALKKQFQITKELDYGALVPLDFMLEAGFDGTIVHVTIGLVSPLELYQAGMLIQKAADQLGRRIVVIASGDNSHALTDESPEGARPEGKQFDDMLVDGIRHGKWTELILTDRDFSESAAEDTILSLTIMLGCLEGSLIQPSLLSYEAPFGIGYTVATFRGSGRSEVTLYTSLQHAISSHIQQRRTQESPPVKLARLALEYYVRHESRPTADKLKQLVTLDMDSPHGVFVTIKQHGYLRGCIGSTEPVSASLYEDIITYAIETGTEDDRFFPVEEDELDELIYQVSLLSPPEPVTSPGELDPKRYGVIVETDEHYGLLLPDLAGVEDVQTQLAYALEKAGLTELTPDVRLYRFTASEYQ
ncbi:AmmeMemoRadiSam system protein A [Brevibacillus dissolubilis]|uniref:AmmeMemoRadiSam system protein A n=1 Tax=Brevibacillus dissolubilis TaxID=1844116 RepID=UPI00159BAE1A|nr:AmmeMemoRadiSam system protein A [Brevibacillus dissolubilis]